MLFQSIFRNARRGAQMESSAQNNSTTGNYVFIDVETPNRRNASICQIGALLTDSNLNVIKTYNQFINPHEAFDPFNTKIHGITASDVYSAPSFGEFYTSEFKDVLNDSILVGHNILSFDINVLNKTICNNNLPFPSDVKAIDTLTLSRVVYSGMVDDFGLDTLCKASNIALDHHDALSDATACYELYKLLRESPDVLTYSGQIYSWHDTGHTERVASRALGPVMTELYGFIVGIKLDHVIKDEEIAKLTQWMQRNAKYKATPIFEDVFSLLDEVIADGVLTLSECEQILNTISPFMESEFFSSNTEAENILRGIIQGISADEKINFDEAIGLLQWRNNYPSLRLNSVYEQLFDKVYESVEDKTITSDENEELIKLCKFIVDPIENAGGQQTLQSSDIKDSIVVLTGEFDHGSRSSVESELEKLGFVAGKSVTKKTNYVVIGNKGSEAYAHGSYGSKVEKAMKYGIPVLTEDDFFEQLKTNISRE